MKTSRPYVVNRMRAVVVGFSRFGVLIGLLVAAPAENPDRASDPLSSASMTENSVQLQTPKNRPTVFAHCNAMDGTVGWMD
jgi:ABC-type transport system substrate-binding protein